MQYKTIVLELLQQRPQIYDRLIEHRTLLATLNLYASQLRTRHLAWRDHLSQTKPASAESQIASEALELALQELDCRLPYGSPQDEADPLTLDAAMAFIHGHTPPA
jgi:hypothetical protein